MSESSADQVNSEIPETMQAVICHGPENYKLEDVPVPKPGPGEALVKVEATGICASDLKCYHGAAKFWGDANRPAWARPRSFPATSSSEKLFSWMMSRLITGASRWATGLSPSRSCPAGSAATA